MAEEAQRIEEAQELTTITIAGVVHPRVAYGDEDEDQSPVDESCRECGVVKGQLHVPGCEVERCPACGDQAVECDCQDEVQDDDFDEYDEDFEDEE